jgi:uncharacterized protein
VSESFPPASSNERPLSVGSAAIWTLLAILLDLLFVSVTEAGREGALYDLVSRTACQGLAYSIAFFGILRLHEPETSIRHVLALRTPSIFGILLALVVGAAMSLPSEWFDRMLEVKFPRSLAEKEALERILAVSTLGKKIALFTTIVVLGPAFDELFFRGVMFTPLRRTRTLASVILITAGLEMFGSLSARAMLSIAAPTLVFAWLRGRTGSIWAPLTARMAYYGVGVVPLVLGHPSPEPTRTALLVSIASGTVAAAALALLAPRSSAMSKARLADGA